MDRITLLASLAKDANSLVDVGCDHGYVAIKALNEYNVKKAYLLDVNEAPLNNAKKNVTDKNLDSRCTFILSDGLKSYDSETETLIIAGMGGMLISKIIQDSFDKVKKFSHIILEANNEVDKLRGFLINSGFKFTNEHLILDGKRHYEIIEGTYIYDEKPKYTLLDMKYGPFIRKENSLLFQEIIAKRKKLLNDALSKATDEVSKSKIRVELAFILMLEGEMNAKN